MKKKPLVLQIYWSDGLTETLKVHVFPDQLETFHIPRLQKYAPPGRKIEKYSILESGEAVLTKSLG